MKAIYDLSQLNWRLSGWTPELWRLVQTMELGETPTAEVMAIPAKVPGSVQYSLRAAGLVPDWNVGLGFRECEWVENRHWIYEVVIPDEWIVPGRTYRLNCLGLDYVGEVILNCKTIGTFKGTHIPHVFDLTPHLAETGNVLRLVFDLAPRWLGQFGFTSRVKEWKVRFNYTWDWIPRVVQAGIWDAISIEATDGQEISEFSCVADADVSDGTGSLKAFGRVASSDGSSVRVELCRDGKVIHEETVPAAQFTAVGLSWRVLPVDLWWPNLEGEQPLYDVVCTLIDSQGNELDSASRRVGFKNVTWKSCEGAPEHADPWLCTVNGRPIFLQGVNFPPILPNFADVTEADYRKRLDLYRDLGCNIFRVNGVGFLETECFYNLCDERGILVWQDVPLSSSGVENLPPDDQLSIDGMAQVLESFIRRRRHHASLLLWCGGNELQRKDSEGRVIPCGLEQPMLARFKQIVDEMDPSHRFIATTSTGPRFGAEAAEFGKGLHWDVHGPWKPWDSDLKDWEVYWKGDDALFRSESGAPSASSVEIIERYAGNLNPLPVTEANDLWHRPVAWWVESYWFNEQKGRMPETLKEYVEWSQDRQAKALSIAVGACKDRFPRCGGIMLWTGHDCYPCAANTSIVDFSGDPKPAALALSKIWRARPSGG